MGRMAKVRERRHSATRPRRGTTTRMACRRERRRSTIILGSLVEIKQGGCLKPRVWWGLGVGLIVAAVIGFGVWRLETHGHGNEGRLPGSPCEVKPKAPELLYEVGDLALFAGETESDATRNAAARKADLMTTPSMSFAMVT